MENLCTRRMSNVHYFIPGLGELELELELQLQLIIYYCLPAILAGLLLFSVVVFGLALASCLLVVYEAAKANRKMCENCTAAR